MPSTEVNTGQASDPSLWVTISDLARLKKVDKAWISRRVGKWEQDQQITTRPGPRGSKLVNRAEYDRLARETTDLGKEQAATTVRVGREELPLDQLPGPAQSKDQSFSAAQRDRAIYEAELKKLDLAERRGLVVAIIKLAEALHRLADTIVQLIDRLPLRAGELAAAVAKDGEIGARTMLKTIALDLRSGIAGAFRKFEVEGVAEESAGIEVDFPEDTAE